MTDTATVHVWQGDRRATYDDLLDEGPDEYEVPVAATDYGRTYEVSDDARVMLADAIEHHGTYAFDVPDADRPLTLNVYTNDSYHDPEEWGDPLERGLTYRAGDDAVPFQVELWGRVMLWVERPEDGESE